MSNPRQKKRTVKWFKLQNSQNELPEFDHILDLYWGGSERRITTLTTRIIGINALALILLLIGIVSLSQYQENLIEIKTESFEKEVNLILTTLSYNDLGGYKDENNTSTINPVLKDIWKKTGHQIRVFTANGALIGQTPRPVNTRNIKDLQSIKMLKKLIRIILVIIPRPDRLKEYELGNIDHIKDHTDTVLALTGVTAVSAWIDKNHNILMTAAVPIIKEKNIQGIALITRDGQDIQNDLSDMWIRMLGAFAITVVFTIIVSIYLSGVIAKPLKKLSKTAEGVRKGKLKHYDIPDYSKRNDEIGDLSIALRQMTEALSDRMDSIENFAADVAHELKNPLTSLKSAVEALTVAKKKEDRVKLTDIVLHDVDRLNRLITDISTSSKLDAQLSRQTLEEIDIKSIISNILDTYQNPLGRTISKSHAWQETATAKNINIVLSSNTEAPILVWALSGRLEQVINNIISNALSFSPENANITIKALEGKNNVKILIEDQGPGIPKNKLEDIFERFYSERPHTEAYGRHSGLGLSICKQIVAAFGGDIFAENIYLKNNEATEPQGARFTIILKKVVL